VAVSLDTVQLDGASLTLGDLERLARGRARVVLAPGVRERVARSRAVVEEALAGGRVVYGLNTGFGRLVSHRINPDQVRELQGNLLRSHAAGVGELLPDPTVRAMIALRVNALAQGLSGVRPELLEALLALLEADILPCIPARGSVGASGDLAPLAHLGLGLMGEGRVRWRGLEMEASRALAEAGLAPFVPEAKEGLAIINGTQLMTAVGALALARARRLLVSADVIAAMSVEALMGTDTCFDPALVGARGHPGQAAVAANLRRCLAGSALVASHKDCHRVQDPYSLRCVPQVHGAAREGWSFAARIVEREMNAVTDNPLVFPEDGRVVSGGNFHGAPVAMALDTAALALAVLGTISERRCDRLLGGSEELPVFLTRHPGLHSGLMLAQYTAAALASENKVLCHPASVDTIPTSAGQEDHVSMGPAAAFKLERLVGNLEQVVACEWVCAAQALEFRRPLTFGPGTEAALAALRRRVPAWDRDRPLAPDLEAARRLVEEGEPAASAEAAAGPLD
jgi:histidine ammonia-lyase